MSVEAIFETLDPVMTRWTMGGQAASVAPTAWQSALDRQEASEKELRLLALAGQYLGLCITPAPATALTRIADVPRLSLPLLPEALAGLARRCLKTTKDSAARRDLIHLIAARGYSVHPADWMPARTDDDVPDAYAPWRDWAHAQSEPADVAAGTHDALTEANWADWWPAARRIALNRLRIHDPARATALLAARAGNEAADARLRLIECLATGLSDADIPYLESLSQDRAPKIKAFAATMLARLGHSSGDSEDAAELTAFFEFQTRGLLRRTRLLVPRIIKSPAQHLRRELLFTQVDYSAFADALTLAPEELIALWPLGTDDEADQSLAKMVEQSASSSVLEALCARLMQESPLNVPIIIALRARLDTGWRSEFARRVLQLRGGTFRAALTIAGPGCGLSELIATVPGKTLINSVNSNTDLSDELQALALIAAPSAARTALEAITNAGLTLSDPRLDLLRLNAALDYSGAQA